MKLIDFIQTYDNVISAQTCVQIINQFEEHKSQIEHHDTELYNFDQLNLNRTAGMQQLAAVVANNLIPVYKDYFKSLRLSEYVSIDTFEDIRIKKYKKGTNQQFKTHVDIMDKSTASRFCIAILYLNDNNGYTTFPNLNVAVQPKAGRVVMFPPTWMFPHNGLTPSDNDKYIMMTCLHYK